MKGFVRCYKSWREDVGRWRAFKCAVYACFLSDPFGFEFRRVGRIFKEEGVEGIERYCKEKGEEG